MPGARSSLGALRIREVRVVREPRDAAEAEVLLVEQVDADVWEGLARPSRRLRPGERLGNVELLQPLGEGRWRLRLHGTPDGEMPLPPYITERLDEPERYQTVYSREPGSAAALTWGAR